ncbi:MAG: ATP-binding cassette domain-containing protein [Oscillospiraceae bacterium]|nr:ATP-binding cassette domain-containing protein [Oscillospiraceae bacterium]
MQLDAENVTMIYPSGKKALADISFHAQDNGFIGILGPNGAGKTTLMKLLIAGLIPTKGKIMLNGKPLLSQEKKLKSQLGYLPQSFGLYDELTVWQFLDYISALKGIKDRKAVEKVIEKTGLTEYKKVRIRNLSGGQRQRVGIAQAITGDPQLLILDEPTVGLDPEERVRFRNIFSDMAQDKIVLLSTHIVEDVQAACSRVLVIYDGMILYDGSPSDLICKAKGHVGTFTAASERDLPDKCHVISKINVSDGIQYRIVAHQMPFFTQDAEPTLEDAYLYCIHREE